MLRLALTASTKVRTINPKSAIVREGSEEARIDILIDANGRGRKGRENSSVNSHSERKKIKEKKNKSRERLTTKRRKVKE